MRSKARPQRRSHVSPSKNTSLHCLLFDSPLEQSPEDSCGPTADNPPREEPDHSTGSINTADSMKQSSSNDFPRQAGDTFELLRHLVGKQLLDRHGKLQ